LLVILRLYVLFSCQEILSRLPLLFISDIILQCGILLFKPIDICADSIEEPDSKIAGGFASDNYSAPNIRRPIFGPVVIADVHYR
jgi:hypothetical protein